VPLTRLRLVGAMVRPAARSARWQPMLAAGALGGILAFVQTRDPCARSGAPPCLDPSARLTALRVAALLLAVGAAFLLDDPAEESTAHLPTPRWLVRALRVALALPAMALVWAATVRVALPPRPDPSPYPVGALTLEAGALVAAGLAIAAAAAALVPEGLGGVAAGPVVLALVGAALLLPERFQPFVGPAHPRWRDAHEQWALAGAAALALLAWASRDRWRRRWLARGPSAGRGPAPAGDRGGQEARRLT
jgi:hypothetical protein